MDRITTGGWHALAQCFCWSENLLSKGLRQRRYGLSFAMRELADRHGLHMQTPLLTLSRALRCTCGGERKAQGRLEPHGYGAKLSVSRVVGNSAPCARARLASTLPRHDCLRWQQTEGRWQGCIVLSRRLRARRQSCRRSLTPPYRKA